MRNRLSNRDPVFAKRRSVMYLLANGLPTQLEVLDAQDNALSHIHATLCHLDSKGAILSLPAGEPAPCLHWGARIRFCMEDGSQCYEILGVVLAHDREPEQAT